MAETALDRAHAAMEAAPDSDEVRLRFFDAFAGAELFLLLESEAEGGAVVPRVFPIDGQGFVLAFDTEERLAGFVGTVAPTAVLSGRTLAAMIAGAQLGLALNPDAAPSATVLPPEAVAWLAATLAETPAEVEARPVRLLPLSDFPAPVIEALATKLAAAESLATHAWLSAVTYGDGRTGHLLAVIGARPGAEPGLAQAIGEALTFSGVETGELDVAFFPASDPVAERIAKVGLRFDIPVRDDPPFPAAPGTDPTRPPRLR